MRIDIREQKVQEITAPQKSQRAIRKRTGVLLDAQLQLLVSQLYLTNQFTQKQISDRLKSLGYEVAQCDVSRIIKGLEEKWRRSTMINIDQVMTTELAKLDMLEHEAFESMRCNAVSRDMYCDQLLRIHDRRMKLLGLDKKKIEVSGPGGRPLTARVTELSDENLAAIVAGESGQVPLPEERKGTQTIVVPASECALVTRADATE
jgi:hypothetical protein